MTITNKKSNWDGEIICDTDNMMVKIGGYILVIDACIHTRKHTRTHVCSSNPFYKTFLNEGYSTLNYQTPPAAESVDKCLKAGGAYKTKCAETEKEVADGCRGFKECCCAPKDGKKFVIGIMYLKLIVGKSISTKNIRRYVEK